jgi:methionine salvage enolase-phosphatase E1
MVPATSGNFSARLPDNNMAITVSGRHKGRLTAAEIGLGAEQVLFLSDVVAELDAAAAAGMQTAWLVRDKQDATASRHPVCHDFSEIYPGS